MKHSCLHCVPPQSSSNPYLQLADAGHGAAQQDEEHAGCHRGACLARMQPVGRQVRRHQRRRAGRVRRQAWAYTPQ
jgi:hypothetical protein